MYQDPKYFHEKEEAKRFLLSETKWHPTHKRHFKKAVGIFLAIIISLFIILSMAL